MTLTVIGEIVRPDGHTLRANALGEVDDVAWVPAAAFTKEQPADIGVHFDHDRDASLGEVHALWRSNQLGLLGVAVLDADVHDILKDGSWYFSDGITCKRLGKSLVRGAAVMHELSLVRRTGNCGTRPVTVVEGDITRGTAAMPRSMPMSHDAAWEYAAESTPRRYRRNRPTPIFDADELTEVDLALADPSRLVAPKKQRVMQVDGVWLDEDEAARFMRSPRYLALMGD